MPCTLLGLQRNTIGNELHISSTSDTDAIAFLNKSTPQRAEYTHPDWLSTSRFQCTAM